ncbi:GxxExxY protein [Desulfotalea psychrophila]|nr:GxxExxY protein [Desulfotalea psychrophila]
MDTKELTGTVIGCAIEVHRQLGPGLLESSYERCLLYELQCLNIAVRTQVALPIRYKDIEIDAGYRIDLLVADELIVELKVVDKLLPLHTAQVLTYMKLAGVRTGLLINFNVLRLVDGVRRLVL